MTVNQLNRTFYPLVLILLLTLSSFGQDTKTITLEDAFQSRFYPGEPLGSLRFSYLCAAFLKINQ